MKLSVIITYYNQEAFVDKSVMSVLAQKCNFDYEIIIGDDGSSDGTVAKIQSWQSRYPDVIKYFVQPRDPGVEYDKFDRIEKHKTFLVKQAKGDFFIVLDGDDWFEDKDKLQLQVSVLEKPENNDCIGSASNLYQCFEGNPTLYQVRDSTHLERKFSAAQYIPFRYFSTPQMLFRNLFHGKIPAELENRIDDHQLTFYMLRFGKIYYVPTAFAVYRRYDQSCCSSCSKEQMELQKLVQMDALLELAPSFRRYILCRFYRDPGFYHMKDGVPAELYARYLQIAHNRNAINLLDLLTYSQKSSFQKRLYRIQFMFRRMSMFYQMFFYSLDRIWETFVSKIRKKNGSR